MKTILPAIILGCVLLSICGNPAQLGDYAQDVHERAWLNVAQAAASSKAHKYGIYQSRSIAVHNPEVYLNADVLFNKLLREISGMGSYYLERTQDLLEQKQVYESIRKNGGKRFKWSDFDINNHNKVDYQSIYHTNAFLPFVDIRLYFLGTALKGTGWQATPLSMVEFLYFKYQATKDYLEMFILVNEAGEAFLYAKSNKKSKQDILIKFDETNVAQPDGKIVLIFNQKFVWYPMFDRNDCDKNVILKNIVSKYASSDNQPVLTDTEMKIVDILRQSTRIIDDEDRLWATSFAAKLHADCWRYFPEIFRQTYPRDAKAGFNTSDGPNMMIARNAFIARISNWLCPATAELAAVAHQYEGESLDVIMKNTTSKYLDYVETRKNPRTGGLTLWFDNEVNFHNMDDHYFSKAANCIYSATDAAAIFDLASIPDLEIYLIGMSFTGLSGGHSYTQFFRNNELGVIENTRWANGFNGLYQGRDGPVINTIIDDDGWVSLREAAFFGINAVRASLAKEVVVQLLQRVKDRSGSNAKIPEAALPRGNSVTPAIPIDTFLKEFETKLEFEKLQF